MWLYTLPCYLTGGFIVLLQQNHNSPYKGYGKMAAEVQLPLGDLEHVRWLNLPGNAQEGYKRSLTVFC